MSTEGTYLNIIKTIYDKLTANIVIIDEKLKAVLLRSGTRQGCPLSLLSFNIVLEALVMANRQEKETKGIQTGKVTLSQFAEDRPLYKENPKDAIRKLLEFYELGKVAGYKINTEKSLVFLHNNNERS